MSVVSPPAPLVASLSRRDLQALGKSLGVKVNGKNAEIIALIEEKQANNRTTGVTAPATGAAEEPMDVDTAATDEFAQPEAVTRTSDICTRLLDSLRQANPQSTREALAWLQWQQLDLARAPTVNDENKQALEEQPVSIKQATEEQPVSIKRKVSTDGEEDDEDSNKPDATVYHDAKRVRLSTTPPPKQPQRLLVDTTALPPASSDSAVSSCTTSSSDSPMTASTPKQRRLWKDSPTLLKLAVTAVPSMSTPARLFSGNDAAF